jgi:hypothetical protein
MTILKRQNTIQEHGQGLLLIWEFLDPDDLPELQKEYNKSKNKSSDIKKLTWSVSSHIKIFQQVTQTF